MFSGLVGTLANRAMARTPQGQSPFGQQGPSDGMQMNGGIGAGGMSGMAEGMFGSKEQNKEDGSPWGSLVKKASFEFNEKGAEGPTDEAKAKPMTPPQAPEQPTIGAGFSGFKFPSWVPGSQPPIAGSAMGPSPFPGMIGGGTPALPGLPMGRPPVDMSQAGSAGPPAQRMPELPGYTPSPDDYLYTMPDGRKVPYIPFYNPYDLPKDLPMLEGGPGAGQAPPPSDPLMQLLASRFKPGMPQ